MLFGLDLNFGSANHPSFWNKPRHQWLGPYPHFCLLQRHWNFLFQSHEPRFFTPMMDSALRLLYGPCLASCEPSMVLVWRGYFWMDGLKSTRAISSKLSWHAGCFFFTSNDMLVPKKGRHTRSHSAKRCFLWCIFAIFIGSVFASTSAR